jgi:hypothetical protein
LIEAQVAAMDEETGLNSSEPQKRFERIRKGVEQKVDKNEWCQTFCGDDANEREFFQVFA